jgi:hypothetical protein
MLVGKTLERPDSMVLIDEYDTRWIKSRENKTGASSSWRIEGEEMASMDGCVVVFVPTRHLNFCLIHTYFF